MRGSNGLRKGHELGFEPGFLLPPEFGDEQRSEHGHQSHDKSHDQPDDKSHDQPADQFVGKSDVLQIMPAE